MALTYELVQRFVDVFGLDAVQSFQAAGPGGHASEIGGSSRLHLVKFIVEPLRYVVSLYKLKSFFTFDMQKRW